MNGQCLGDDVAVGVGGSHRDDDNRRDHEPREHQQAALAKAVAVAGRGARRSTRRARWTRRRSVEIGASAYQGRLLRRLLFLPEPLRKGHLLGRAHRPPRFRTAWRLSL